VDRSDLRDAIDRALALWSGDWFAERRLRVRTLRAAQTAPVDIWRLSARGVALCSSERARARLLDWALDRPADPAAPTPAHRDILTGVETAMFDDLVERMAPSAAAASTGPSIQPAPAPGGGAEIIIEDDQAGELVLVWLPVALLAPRLMAVLPPPRPGVALTALTQALSNTPVAVEATLGYAELSFTDLKGLAPGDVLVLETRLDAPGQIGLVGQAETFARADLTDLDGQAAVRLRAQLELT
jgi:hypothetical protein